MALTYILFFSPLIYLGLFLLAVSDLRFTPGEERRFLRLTFASTLPLVFFGALLWASAQHLWLLNAGFGGAMIGTYLMTVRHMVQLRRESIAKKRATAALVAWVVSVIFYVGLLLWTRLGEN